MFYANTLSLNVSCYEIGLSASTTSNCVTIPSREKLEVSMSKHTSSPFLTVAEAADYLRLKKRTWTTCDGWEPVHCSANTVAAYTMTSKTLRNGH